jgi:hypothetical protein
MTKLSILGHCRNGDALQFAFTNDKQTETLKLVNFALSESGDHIIHDEFGFISTSVMIKRDEKTLMTTYEAKFGAGSFGLETLAGGMRFGVGICLNEGDLLKPGQSGQHGWAGFIL